MTTLAPAMPPARWFPGAACFRGVLIALSCAVSLAYAAAGVANTLPAHPGAAVAVATVAWCALFTLTWALSPARHRVARFDWCLWTVTVGSVFMLAWLAIGQAAAALGMNPQLARFAPLAGLANADLAMAWVFTRYAPTVAVRRVHALLIWIAGMNGLLVAGMLLADTLIGGTR